MKRILLLIILILSTQIIRAEIKDAIFGVGCFWTGEYKFEKIEGVVDAEAGYVCEKRDYPNPSGQASGSCYIGGGFCTEVVKIKYNDEKITYKELLLDFWDMHDASIPTDILYRSAIYYFDESQKRVAESMLSEMQVKESTNTLIEKAGNYIKAGKNHQDYLKKRGYR